MEGGRRRMAFRMRVSKFRHIYGSPAKKENCYECIKITKNAHDSNFCAVNPKFVAIVTESAGGGAFLVLPIERVGRVDINSPKVCGHSGPVLDIKWNPFNDHIIASCSDDATVKLWQIPDNGLRSNLTEWLVDLHGHQRRVGYIEWHPTAENILLSAGYDFKCILWNTETAEPINIIDCHTDTIFSISWNRDGSLFATTCKDKKIRVIDPREGVVVAEGPGHQGPKASKVVFLADRNLLVTTGFSRMSERQLAVWDAKKLSSPIKIETVDSSSGVLFPYYDADTKVIFVAGKGDGNIRFYEVTDEQPYLHYLEQYQSSSPQRGLGTMPKRGIEPGRCEIMRFYKLHAVKGICEPVSMIVPRKSEMFQEDIFPATASSTASLSADEWISGLNRDPILISLKNGQTLSPPRVSTGKSLKKQDGAISNSPTITTYKAVKRSTSNVSTSVSSNQGLKRQQTAPPTATVAPVSPSKLPASVHNIRKLSVAEDEDQLLNNVRPEGKENINDMINSFERKNITVTTATTRLTNANQQMNVDKKVWSSSYVGNNYNANGVPGTDSELPSLRTPTPPTSPRSPSSVSQEELLHPPLLEESGTEDYVLEPPDSGTPLLTPISALARMQFTRDRTISSDTDITVLAERNAASGQSRRWASTPEPEEGDISLDEIFMNNRNIVHNISNTPLTNTPLTNASRAQSMISDSDTSEHFCTPPTSPMDSPIRRMNVARSFHANRTSNNSTLTTPGGSQAHWHHNPLAKSYSMPERSNVHTPSGQHSQWQGRTSIPTSPQRVSLSSSAHSPERATSPGGSSVSPERPPPVPRYQSAQSPERNAAGPRRSRLPTSPERAQQMAANNRVATSPERPPQRVSRIAVSPDRGQPLGRQGGYTSPERAPMQRGSRIPTSPERSQIARAATSPERTAVTPNNRSSSRGHMSRADSAPQQRSRYQSPPSPQHSQPSPQWSPTPGQQGGNNMVTPGGSQAQWQANPIYDDNKVSNRVFVIGKPRSDIDKMQTDGLVRNSPFRRSLQTVRSNQSESNFVRNTPLRRSTQPVMQTDVQESISINTNFSRSTPLRRSLPHRTRTEQEIDSDPGISRNSPIRQNGFRSKSTNATPELTPRVSRNTSPEEYNPSIGSNSNLEDGSDDSFIHTFAFPSDAPDNTLIKPSKLRESMRRGRMRRTASTPEQPREDSNNNYEVKHYRDPSPDQNSDYRSDSGPTSPRNVIYIERLAASAPESPARTPSRGSPQNRSDSALSNGHLEDTPRISEPAAPVQTKSLAKIREQRRSRQQRMASDPQGDSSRVHVKRVWSTDPSQPARLTTVTNGLPDTDPELRKAYFQQLEEIRSLKEQIGMKDKRIRQLEEEVNTLREMTGLDESTC